MSEPLPPPPPSPLELLYFLRRVQVQQLATTDRWIKEAEKRQAALAARRPPPPPPDWVLKHSGKDKTPMYVHAGPCNTRMRTRQVITAQEARRLITDGVRACVLCRPDTELGIIG
ncbi:DUF6233 domain-containing protein [Streptomyces sp. CA-251247]|uniref:DUF6233 domain-containing protein n=1 Tax=Streptomyces sp. CA-251247 TaxID=3240062 RepID=UPI003D92FCF4